MSTDFKKKTVITLEMLKKKASQFIHTAKERLQNQENKEMPNATLPKKGKSEEVIMHISVRSIVKSAFAILAIIIGVWLAANLIDKIILLLMAVFVATLLDPGVQIMEKFRIPRMLGILIQYFIAILLISFLISKLIPTIGNELIGAAQELSRSANKFIRQPDFSFPLIPAEINDQLIKLSQEALNKLSINQFTGTIENFGRDLFTAAQDSISFIAGIAGSFLVFLAKLIVVLVMAFFMQLEKEKIIKWVEGFFPPVYRKYIEQKTILIHKKISQWSAGQLTLSFSIFILTYIALLILSLIFELDYVLTFAALAGFCEFIPYVGPFIAAAAPMTIALANGDWLLFLVLGGVYYLIQWTENNLLVPLIMRRAVGLSPVAILFAMLVGLSFPDFIHPVLGIMLAIPTTTIIVIFLKDWQKTETRKN